MWTVTVPDTWNAAMSALIDANGNPSVMAIPTADADHRWIVLRRVPTEAYTQWPTPPFTVETFDSPIDAYARFSAFDNAYTPMLISTPDGKTVVLAAREPSTRTRAVRH